MSGFRGTTWSNRAVMWFVGKPGLDPSGHLGKGHERSVSLQETATLHMYICKNQVAGNPGSTKLSEGVNKRKRHVSRWTLRTNEISSRDNPLLTRKVFVSDESRE